MIHTMKKEGGYDIDEIYKMYPFEMDIFHSLCIKDIKDRIEAKKAAARG